uniref:KAT8 regulatory NSL complex subunit 2 n=1 Tax=Trichogramma kaykai TaxID=54128 RepID=A0ABD2WNP2_9HYME
MYRAPSLLLSSNTAMPQTHTLTHKQKCSYSYYECMQPCLEVYSYCPKHILEDPNAPYTQCNYIYSINGRKCQNAAHILDKKEISYCPEHTRRAQIARTKSASKHSLPESPETILLGLKHYVKSSDSLKASIKIESNENQLTEPQEKSEILNPFTQMKPHEINARGPDILDDASSSDSDVEPTWINETVRGIYFEDSDNESLHSLEEDPLKHADVYTTEEIVYITKEKLIRLQTLYMDQYKKLQATYKDRKRKYHQALKKEKETSCNIHDQPKDTAKEKKIYQKFKALNNYHKRSGIEAILHKKSLERKAKISDGPTQKGPSVQKCIFTEGGVKCGDRTLPSSKYCRKHILKDQMQVLFKACGAVEGDTECHEPVTVIFDKYCVFHSKVPSDFKLEPTKFKDVKPQWKENFSTDKMKMDISGLEGNQEIDPDDDIAGIMREMNDIENKKTMLNDSLNSEASTDTAFSLNAQMSDRDDLV